MANENEEKSFQKEALEWFIKTKLTLLDAFKGIEGLTDGKLSKVVIGKTGAGVGAIIDYAQGHSVEEIAGKTFGTAVDILTLKSLRSVFKYTPDTKVLQYVDNLLQGAIVVGFEEFADYSAADYFEKAFPAASQFYKTLYNDVVNGDGFYAREIWEGLKATADIDLIKNYYATATFEQWFNDFKDLLNPSYTLPDNISGNEQGKVTFEQEEHTHKDKPKEQTATETLKDNVAKTLNIDSETLDATLDSRSTMPQEERMRGMFKAIGFSDKEYDEMIYAKQNNISHPILDQYRTEAQKATLIPAETKPDNDDVHRQ
jgi:hypothetical protein